MTHLAAKEKYYFLLNLGFLGFTGFLSLFEVAFGKPYFVGNLEKFKHFDYSLGTFINSEKKFNLQKSKSENISLTLKIFSDKQYDHDQNVYLAEGNVKAFVNGGILRSDYLKYEKSTGILSARGNIRFSKGRQYFRGSAFEFNLLNNYGFIRDAYGILDINNVFNDLRIDSNSGETIERNVSMDKSNINEKNDYSDGIEFSFGNINLPQNKITRSNKSSGSINSWRFKSDLIHIREDGWSSDKVNFTNDPFDPHQISFEGIDVIAEEKEGQLLITSSKTNIILERRTKIFLGKRIFGAKQKKRNKFDLIFDGKDRDGLVLIRRSNTTNINKNIKLDFHPQFLINRAILGKTNSYKENKIKDKKSINFYDLFGANLTLNANYKDWKFESINDLSTLNKARFSGGIRHSSSFRKYFEMPILNDLSFNIFTTYRSRAWNGTIGETEIKTAYGGFIEKSKIFKAGEVINNLNIRIGTAKYKAEKLNNRDMISLRRSSIFSSLDSQYQIWKGDKNKLYEKKNLMLSPVLINPEVFLITNINAAFFQYEDGSNQGFLKFSLGPEIRLGRLEKRFLDFTKISFMPGLKIKSGNSPFKFDNAIDLKTLNISLMQQIYGPMILDITSNLNIDMSSDKYGEYYDTNLGLLWQKRAYEFGIYYHPNTDGGGLYFRINGFNFDNHVKAVF